MAVIRRSAQLPEEFKLLLVLKEATNDVVPYRAPDRRHVHYYFKRADTLGIAGQYRPEPRIDIIAILKDGAFGKEIGRENHTVDTPEKVADHIRLTGYLATDVVESHVEEYPYFRHLRFFNDVIPRPGWLDEKVQ